MQLGIAARQVDRISFRRHGFVGQPHRIRAFQKVMEYILSHPGVWVTTGENIANWYNENHLPAIEAHLAGVEAANG